jgi:hypothetical protein
VPESCGTGAYFRAATRSVRAQPIGRSGHRHQPICGATVAVLDKHHGTEVVSASSAPTNPLPPVWHASTLSIVDFVGQPLSSQDTFRLLLRICETR